MTATIAPFARIDNGDCFICGTKISDSGVNIIDVRTSFLSVPFPNKLCEIVGNKFIVVVSKQDKICEQCFLLVNHLDGLEHDFLHAKKRVFKLLRNKYNFDLEVVQDEAFAEVFTANSEKHNIGRDICSYSFISSEVVNRENINCDDSKHCLLDNLDDDKDLDIFDFAEDIVHDSIDSTENSAVNPALHIFEAKGCSSSNDLSVTCIEEELGDSTFIENIKGTVSLPSKDSARNEESCLSEDKNQITHLENDESGKKSVLVNSGSAVINITERVEAIEWKRRGMTTEVEEVSVDIEVPLVDEHEKLDNSVKRPEATSAKFQCHDKLQFLRQRKDELRASRSITCVICEDEFISNNDLKKHLLLSHMGKKFTCSKCGQEFNRYDRFKNHTLYGHGNEKCHVCGKHIPNAVKLREHVRRHARIHSQEYICEVCGKAFKTPGGLRLHKVSHTGDYKFFCEVCGRGFMSSLILEEHKGVHTREERYVCDICGRKFVLYTTLHLHKQWHRNPFPFPCSMCDKKFKYRSVRTNHIRRDHTGENPYKCTYCDAAFLKKSYLRRHVIQHTKEYPFYCPVCKKGFDQRRNMARHLSRVHGDKSLVKPSRKCEYKVMLRPDEFPQLS